MNVLGPVKDILIECMKTETRTPYGKMNLAWGVALINLVGLMTIPAISMAIIQCIFPSVGLLVPWYGLIIMLIILVVFFLICIRYVGQIEQHFNESNNTSVQNKEKCD